MAEEVLLLQQLTLRRQLGYQDSRRDPAKLDQSLLAELGSDVQIFHLQPRQKRLAEAYWGASLSED